MKRFLAFLLAAGLLLCFVPAASAAEHSEYVDGLAIELRDLGILQGFPDGTFGLNQELTRAEALVILLRAMGLYEPAGETPYRPQFSDVQEGGWASSYVLFAYDYGITKGTSDTTFSPNTRINAQQFLTLLLRYYLNNTAISPETVYSFVVTDTQLSNDYVRNLIDADMFYRSDMVIIVHTLFVADEAPKEQELEKEQAFGEFLSAAYTNISQVGEYFSILFEGDPAATDQTWTVTRTTDTGEVLVDFRGQSNFSAEGSMDEHDDEIEDFVFTFQSVKPGRTAITIDFTYSYEDGSENTVSKSFDIIILEEGMAEGRFELFPEQENFMLCGGLSFVLFDSFPDEGYTWKMLPNDVVELIQVIYYPTLGGALQEMVFTAHAEAETQITLQCSNAEGDIRSEVTLQIHAVHAVG